MILMVSPLQRFHCITIESKSWWVNWFPLKRSTKGPSIRSKFKVFQTKKIRQRKTKQLKVNSGPTHKDETNGVSDLGTSPTGMHALHSSPASQTGHVPQGGSNQQWFRIHPSEWSIPSQYSGT